MSDFFDPYEYECWITGGRPMRRPVPREYKPRMRVFRPRNPMVGKMAAQHPSTPKAN